MISRGTFYCVCGGFCLLLPAALAAAFAPFMCKKHKGEVKNKKQKGKNKK